MPEENPGFDFITLTKAQWAHLKLIERDHGIPWYIYIRDLIKADMEGRLLHPSVRERRRKLKPDISAKRLEVILTKIETIFDKPRQMVSWVPPMTPQSGDFSGILEEKQVEPSKLKEVRVDPNVLTNGVSVQSPEFRDSFMYELREKLGLPPLENKKKASIKFPSHVKIVDAPPPPPRAEVNE